MGRPANRERNRLADASARAVLLAKERDRREQLPWYGQTWAWIQEVSVGYGYRPLSFDMDEFPEGFEIPALPADPAGVRGHTMYHHGSAGSVRYAEFRHLGKKGVLGRYSLHFHLCGDSMRGSSVVGRGRCGGRETGESLNAGEPWVRRSERGRPDDHAGRHAVGSR